ncbi:MAG: nuclear transport factor 2 family protein [Myxococcota bacterium]
MDARIERLGDEQAIRDVLARYWRGIDRRDVALVESSYHPDAYDDHGYYKGPIPGFVESLEPGVWAYFENTQHFSGHIAVEFVDRDRANAESYAEAHHIHRKEDGSFEDLVYGLRYVDRFACRDGEWRIAHRVCTWDWHRIDATGGIPLGDGYFRGYHSHQDPVYQHPRSVGRRVGPDALVAKQACYDTLMRYARGVDRCDPELVRSTYHPDAYDDHGGYQGDANGFIEWVKPTVMENFSCTMHKLGNVLIEIDGEQAFAETYAVAHHVQADQETPSDLIMGVRYIDRLEQRRGEWKIAHRVMSFEWERTLEIGSQAEIDTFKRGLRDGTDPVLRRASPASAHASAALERVADRSAIYGALVRYCRGVDRRDEALIRSAYHLDASDDHGAHQGGVDGLIEYIRKEVDSRFRITMHKLGQALIEIDGEVAHSEAYAICHHIQTEQGKDLADIVAGIRYIDRFERRDGIWRIAQREIRSEWLRTDPLEALDASWTFGTTDFSDPVFAE